MNWHLPRCDIIENGFPFSIHPYTVNFTVNIKKIRTDYSSKTGLVFRGPGSPMKASRGSLIFRLHSRDGTGIVDVGVARLV